ARCRPCGRRSNGRRAGRDRHEVRGIYRAATRGDRASGGPGVAAPSHRARLSVRARAFGRSPAEAQPAPARDHRASRAYLRRYASGHLAAPGASQAGIQGCPTPSRKSQRMTLAPALAGGIRTLGLDVGPAAQAQLLAYIALLAKWNRTHNLTAIRTAEQM